VAGSLEFSFLLPIGYVMTATLGKNSNTLNLSKKKQTNKKFN
jgi:hypothetical protein